MRNTSLCLELSHNGNIFPDVFHLSTNSHSRGQVSSDDLEQDWEKAGFWEVVYHSPLKPRKIRDINDPFSIICIIYYAKWFTLGRMKALGRDSSPDLVSVSVSLLLFKSD